MRMETGRRGKKRCGREGKEREGKETEALDFNRKYIFNNLHDVK